MTTILFLAATLLPGVDKAPAGSSATCCSTPEGCCVVVSSDAVKASKPVISHGGKAHAAAVGDGAWVVTGSTGDNYRGQTFVMPDGQEVVVMRSDAAAAPTPSKRDAKGKDGRAEKGDSDPVASDEQRPAAALKTWQPAQQALPPIWIGVRMAPLPEPLAAHVGDKGLMVANVAKDSPADAAGVERYDVILSFNGREISDAGDLVKAVGDLGAGKNGELSILRGGKKKTLTVKPANRPESQPEYKYEDQSDAIIDNTTKFRGGALKPAPGGGWMYEDLGNLKDNPFGQGFRFQIPDMKNFDPKTFDFNFSMPDVDVYTFKHDDSDPDVKYEVKVRKSDENGESVSIHRDASGQITVERTDADGKTATKTYDDADALNSDDPAAYKMFRGFSHGSGAGANVWRVHPNMRDLPKLQKQWQDQIEEQLEKSQQSQGGGKQKAQRWKAKESKKAAEGKQGGDDQQGGGDDTNIVNVKIDKDGSVTISTERDGQRTENKFKNKAELRKKNPGLYEKFREWTE